MRRVAVFAQVSKNLAKRDQAGRFRACHNAEDETLNLLALQGAANRWRCAA